MQRQAVGGDGNLACRIAGGGVDVIGDALGRLLQFAAQVGRDLVEAGVELACRLLELAGHRGGGAIKPAVELHGGFFQALGDIARR